MSRFSRQHHRAQVHLEEDLSRMGAEPLGAGRRRSSRLLSGGEGLRSLDLVGRRENLDQVGGGAELIRRKTSGGEHQVEKIRQ